MGGAGWAIGARLMPVARLQDSLRCLSQPPPARSRSLETRLRRVLAQQHPISTRSIAPMPCASPGASGHLASTRSNPALKPVRGRSVYGNRRGDAPGSSYHHPRRIRLLCRDDRETSLGQDASAGSPLVSLLQFDRNRPTFRSVEFSRSYRDWYARRVSAELIGIIAVGAALVGVQVTVSLWIVSWLRALDGRVSHVEQRMARLEGLIEGAGLFRPAEALEPAAGD